MASAWARAAQESTRVLPGSVGSLAAPGREGDPRVCPDPRRGLRARPQPVGRDVRERTPEQPFAIGEEAVRDVEEREVMPMAGARHRLVRKAMKDPPGQGESVEGGSATRRKLSRSADTPSLNSAEPPATPSGRSARKRRRWS